MENLIYSYGTSSDSEEDGREEVRRPHSSKLQNVRSPPAAADFPIFSSASEGDGDASPPSSKRLHLWVDSDSQHEYYETESDSDTQQPEQELEGTSSAPEPQEKLEGQAERNDNKDENDKNPTEQQQPQQERELDGQCLEPEPQQGHEREREQLPAEQPLAMGLDLQLGSPLPKQRGPYCLPDAELTHELRAFLESLKTFWTKPICLERRATPLSPSTFCKSRERILCFLGYAKSNDALNTSAFTNTALVERYLDYLRDVRALKEASLSNHVSSILYAVKFLHKDAAPLYRGVPVLAQLRSMATQLQRAGERDRPQTKEDLEALGRWLDWPEVLRAVELQQERFHLAKGHAKSRAMMDLLLLAMYTSMPPARAMEIRTLELYVEEFEGAFDKAQFPDRNVLVRRFEASYELVFQKFKTRKFRSTDRIPVQKGTSCGDLPELLNQYLDHHRPRLLSHCPTEDEGPHYVFVNTLGKPFQAASFSSHLGGIFQKLIGVRVSVNCLRAAFITWAYEQRECDDSMKDSIAAALRHSRREGERTYDRRTAAEKKKPAMELAQSALMQREEHQLGGELVATGDEQDTPRPKPGSFVALVGDNSTLNKPVIFLGRVQNYPNEKEVALLWYARCPGRTLYHLKLDGEPVWKESVDAIFPVQTKTDPKTGGVKLLTSPREVHRMYSPEE